MKGNWAKGLGRWCRYSGCHDRPGSWRS